MKETGTAIGLSLIICVQCYSNQGYGINRAIRNNTTNLMVFKQKDKKSIEKIQKEMGAVLEEEDFYKTKTGKLVLRKKRKKDSFIKAHYRRKYWNG